MAIENPKVGMLVLNDVIGDESPIGIVTAVRKLKSTITEVDVFWAGMEKPRLEFSFSLNPAKEIDVTKIEKEEEKAEDTEE